MFLNNEGAKERATAKAQADLAEKLAKKCDPVHCPHCGHMQAEMVREAKKRYLDWLFKGGVGALCAAVLLGALAINSALSEVVARRPDQYLFWILSSIAAISGLCMLFVKFVLSARLSPNSLDVETRKQLGRTKAVSKDEFFQIISEQPESLGARFSNTAIQPEARRASQS
jgi:hypothetical protein